ncbi:hypothetical protein [Methylosinus sp. Sm6]|uniref:hypothetical protein n=1 Tax=Methylosinus sp. Sm6 TaxID=2866948 RepID=UPI001C992E17|nr:hypothetical protein [Methylosinus sp. Sm6]MBY6244189.1 hypothetical protein [Methylosinus sp. Sm6]
MEVTQIVRVIVDETKFTPEFLAEFAKAITNYDSVDEHICYLARMHVRAEIEPYSRLEGYGLLHDFGIDFEIISEADRLLQEGDAA